MVPSPVFVHIVGDGRVQRVCGLAVVAVRRIRLREVGIHLNVREVFLAWIRH